MSSGGGDPPRISSGFVSSRTIEACATPRFWGGLRLVAAGRRLAAGPRLALVRRSSVVRRFEVARCFAVVRFAVVRRFTGRRFFRDEVAARFLRFAICCLLSKQTLEQRKSSRKEGTASREIEISLR